MDIYWTNFRHRDWQLVVAATAKGICYIGPDQSAFEELVEWLKKRMPEAVCHETPEKLTLCTKELAAYLDGSLNEFSMPVDLYGTPFQQDVWNALQQIPYGVTKNYAEIAESIGRPSAVRAVGGAIGANPILIAVPCHRVIGKNGKLTGFRGGLNMKKKLLELEEAGDLSCMVKS
ncbi:methylated-DNA--[protein]-cysteine S-methyltransferase [Sporosarcina sp. Te-1]|uniref:methylated-DNA--[protein]-cysteine S-methyltransferase n=1 Tax=Sporosarcina sp. Te-1 TaxID=2818390 RepID=UPI001A9DC36B|nr:methylated-DNA--[protein]-cysteine S-methyltransferase [Sporosarcina sp. Te-1]QTD39953.1 methylated-DNA--[protein]-cysteine S-methyltransferase [Sporosarcina sp. Te-1]